MVVSAQWLMQCYWSQKPVNVIPYLFAPVMSRGQVTNGVGGGVAAGKRKREDNGETKTNGSGGDGAARYDNNDDDDDEEEDEDFADSLLDAMS